MSRRFGIAGFAIGLWGLFYPHPYLLCMVLLAIAPFVALAVSLASRGVLDPMDDADRRMRLSTLMVLPPIVLALRAMFDFPYVDGWALFPHGLALGLVCGFAYLWSRPPRQRPVKTWERIAGWVFAVGYGWAVVTMLNGLLPQPAPERFEVPVLAHHMSSGKSRQYYVRLPPVGPVGTEEDWDVGRAAYDRLPVGGRACVFIYPGALGGAWYEADACDASGEDSAD